MQLDLAEFEIPVLLGEVQETVRPMVKAKSQQLKLADVGDLPHLTADRSRIKQVLLNLLSNANKFTPEEGGITLSCNQVDSDHVRFSVTDTGMGVAPGDREVIFDEFRRAANGSPALKVEGTGLGLAISKRLVDMHGGRIWVESDYGHGATFSFLLPVSGPPSRT